jgi:hypothetical protein
MLHKIFYIVSTITDKIKLNFINKKNNETNNQLLNNENKFKSKPLRLQSHYCNTEDIDKLYYGNICFDD